MFKIMKFPIKLLYRISDERWYIEQINKHRRKVYGYWRDFDKLCSTYKNSMPGYAGMSIVDTIDQGLHDCDILINDMREGYIWVVPATFTYIFMFNKQRLWETEIHFENLIDSRDVGNGIFMEGRLNFNDPVWNH